MLKRILKFVIYGIAWGWCWLVGICLIVDIGGFESMREAIFHHFSQNVLASTLTGLGFGTTAIVYTFERLRMWQKALIHFGVGMGIYLPVAVSFGWIPLADPVILIYFLIQSVLVFFAIWSGFYLYHRFEAIKINRQLEALAKERARDVEEK